MSYEASAHSTQMAILKNLLLVPKSSFSVLQKETDLTSDHFNFHLKKLVYEGYVVRDGKDYLLSKSGKEYANRMDTDEKILEKQPKLSVALFVENEQGMFLAQQRLKQPYYSYWGRPTGKIRWGETMDEAVARELLEETGLSADIKIRGVYHKLDFDNADQLLEDKYFIIAHCTKPKGQLFENFEGGKNAWMSNEELLAQDKVFDTVTEINLRIKNSEDFIFEIKHHYSQKDY